MAVSAEANERRFSVVAVAGGIGIGRLVFPEQANLHESSVSKLDDRQLEIEIERLRQAVDSASADLSVLAESDATGVLGVQLLILEDSLVDDIEQTIRDQKVTAEAALRAVSARLTATQRSVADRYIGEKYIDIQDVANRLLTALAPTAESDQLPNGVIYVVEELSPSLLMELARSHPKGLITSQGGWTSHTSILARELRIPIVTGFRHSQRSVKPGEVAIVDAVDGELVIAPTRHTLRAFRTKRLNLIRAAYAVSPEPSHETSDGREIVVRANANTREGYERARRAGASGIGLFRTEGLLRDRAIIPSEDEQASVYADIGEVVGHEGVRIRTFDTGAEQLPGSEHRPANPALGLRAIRLGLANESIFSTQVRAILRASASHRLEIVLPMVSCLDDVFRAKAIIGAQADSLRASGIEVGSPRLGVMIEVPSAVMSVSSIAARVDFLCLGTNDLVQYLLAVDRDDSSVANWYQTLHPAVLLSIREVVLAGEKLGIPVEICGEMAGSPFYVPLLIGMGAVELSMNPNSVGRVLGLIGELDSRRCAELADLAQARETAGEVADVVRGFYRQHWPRLFSEDMLAPTTHPL